MYPLVAWVLDKSRFQLKEPEHEIVTISNTESDEEATETLRGVISAVLKGQYGKKVLLKFETD